MQAWSRAKVQALLALGLEYMALAARLAEPAVMWQERWLRRLVGRQEALVGGMSPLAALLATENIPADSVGLVARLQ